MAPHLLEKAVAHSPCAMECIVIVLEDEWIIKISEYFDTGCKQVFVKNVHILDATTISFHPYNFRNQFVPIQHKTMADTSFHVVKDKLLGSYA